MNFIGISGKARAGKDTAALAICDALGFCRIGLADPMKRFCVEIGMLTDFEAWEDQGEARRDPSQSLGTEWGRSRRPDVWVTYMSRMVKELLDEPNAAYDKREGNVWITGPGLIHPKGVVCSDVRFPNEVEAIQRHGGKVIRIERPGAGLTGEAAHHLSETALDGYSDFDGTIFNNGTEDKFRSDVLQMVRILCAS